METVCNYHKYGHCKFGETCRKFHPKELCKNDDCEIQECMNRHPKSCKYFDEYRRCKFGDFCSFSHKNESSGRGDLADLKARLDVLEKKIEDKDCEIASLNDKVNKMQENNESLQIEFTKAL